MNATSSKDRLTAVVVVLVVVALASVIRLLGLGYGTPYLHHPDEPIGLRVVQTMVRDGDINPHFFDWPSLPLYIQAASYAAYVEVGTAVGYFDGPEDVALPQIQVMGTGILANPNTLAVGRLTTMIFSIGLVLLGLWATWWITRRGWVAALAGGLIALEPLLVKNGRWMTPDTFVAFFALAAIVMAIVVYRSGRWWQYALAGAFAGFAASSKYNAAAVVVAIAVAHALRYRKAFFLRSGIYVAATASLVAFVATMPSLILAPSEALGGVVDVFSHYSSGHFGSEGGQVAFYLTTLAKNLGPLLILVPMAFVGAKLRPVSVILISYPVVQLLMLFRFTVRFDRNLLPIVAPLLILTALGTMNSYDILRRRSGRAAVAAVIMAAVLAVMAIPGLWQLAQDTEKYSGDHRAEARSWFAANASFGSTVVVDAYSPWTDPSRFDVISDGLVLRNDRVFDVAPDMVILTQRGSGRFTADPERYPEQVERYKRLLDEYCVVQRFGGHEAVEFLSRDCGA